MNKHNIILINGKRRSGKGLLSSEIKNTAKKKYENIYVFSFADSIKNISQPILDEINWDKKNKEIVRPLWITLGEVGRKIDNDIWSKKTFNKIIGLAKKSSVNNQNSLFIIDDLRLPNELDYFKANIQKIKDVVKKNDKVSITSIRIEKFIDAQKFVVGIDDDVTEIAFDKLVNICFDYIIPQRILINNEGIPNFDNVKIITKTVVRNYLK